MNSLLICCGQAAAMPFCASSLTTAALFESSAIEMGHPAALQHLPRPDGQSA
jgi:hypothetical protein